MQQQIEETEITSSSSNNLSESFAKLEAQYDRVDTYYNELSRRLHKKNERLNKQLDESYKEFNEFTKNCLFTTYLKLTPEMGLPGTYSKFLGRIAGTIKSFVGSDFLLSFLVFKWLLAKESNGKKDLCALAIHDLSKGVLELFESEEDISRNDILTLSNGLERLQKELRSVPEGKIDKIIQLYSYFQQILKASSKKERNYFLRFFSKQDIVNLNAIIQAEKQKLEKFEEEIDRINNKTEARLKMVGPLAISLVALGLLILLAMLGLQAFCSLENGPLLLTEIGIVGVLVLVSAAVMSLPYSGKFNGTKALAALREKYRYILVESDSELVTQPINDIDNSDDIEMQPVSALKSWGTEASLNNPKEGEKLLDNEKGKEKEEEDEDETKEQTEEKRMVVEVGFQ